MTWRKLKKLSACHKGWQVSYSDYTRNGQSKAVYFVDKAMGQAFVDALNAAHLAGMKLPEPPSKTKRTKAHGGSAVGVHPKKEGGFNVVRGRGAVHFKCEEKAHAYRALVVAAMDAKQPYPPIPSRRERGLDPLTSPISNWKPGAEPLTNHTDPAKSALQRD